MIFKLFYVTLISYLNSLGGRVMLTPPLAWVLGEALGGAARCIFIFFFLDLSHGFAWKLNLEACRAENIGWGAPCVRQ